MAAPSLVLPDEGFSMIEQRETLERLFEDQLSIHQSTHVIEPPQQDASRVERQAEADKDFSRSLVQQINFETSYTVPRICDMDRFDDNVVEICQALFHSLSSQQLEGTFQRCLALDLQSAGIRLCQEVPIELTYRGEIVGHRRADIVLETPSDRQKAVLELKAVAKLTSEHVKQLQFYMHHLEIDTGYLINFPHDRGFPDVPTTTTEGMYFFATRLSGTEDAPGDRSTRTHHASDEVQIIRYERRAGRRVSRLR